MNKLKKEEKVSDWDMLIRKFNLKSFRTEPSIKDFEGYIISWKQNEKSDNGTKSIMETKPPYLNKIT